MSTSGNLRLRNNISDSNLQITKNNYSSMALDDTMGSGGQHGELGAGYGAGNEPVLSNRSSMARFLRYEDQERRR